MAKSCFFTLLSCLALFATFIGCGGDSRLKVAPVKGRITYHGQGVPNAVVVFMPSADNDEKSKKLRPFAYADAQGNFQIKTYIDNDGAPLGKYRVGVVAPSSAPAHSSKDAPAGQSSNSGTTAVAIPQDVIKKYGDAATSGLEVNVQAGDNNLPPFELKSATGG